MAKKKATTKKKASSKAKTPTASAAGKKLLIVESGAKAKTINKMLGRDFKVKASVGHVRDIPSGGRKKKGSQKAFGIDFGDSYKPDYEVIKGRQKTVDELKKLADEASMVYLAPDPDREGEAIAWHLKEVLHLPEEKTKRVTYKSITKRAIQEALDNPSDINMDLVNAQQGRRVLDRIVGFTLSPFLWKKVTKGLSAGRVQSVAVRIVVEREREIQAFKPQEYWKIMADLSPENKREEMFEAMLTEWNGNKFAVGEAAASTEESAKTVAAALEKANFVVQDIKEREVAGRPVPPFITSTLQQSSSTFLRFNTDRTMRIAQQLYEGVEVDGGPVGLITYMRTDSVNIAPEGIAEVRSYIGNHFAPEYLPEKPNAYASRKGAQEAHEAIRPTSVLRTPDSLKPFLTPEQYKLYDLIWRRFVASQMTPSRSHTTTVRIAAADGILEAKGRRVLFDGHTVLGYEATKKKQKDAQDSDTPDADSEQNGKADKDQILPALAIRDALDLHELRTSQNFTQPPPRYSEASLVRALEKEGIGRPSTYAPIVKTIQERGYVRQERRRFSATELGMAVTDILMANFPQIMDYQFTAGMETNLDEVEEGQKDWVHVVDEFYKPFAQRLDIAVEEAEALKGRPAPNGEKCPECEGSMVIRYSKDGAFLGCENYPDCRGTRPMPGEEGPVDGDDGEPEEQYDCPNCGKRLAKKRSRFGEFFGCSNYPECQVTFPMNKEGKPVMNPSFWRRCPMCDSVTGVKRAGKGGMLHCTNKECGYVQLLDENGNQLPVPDVRGMTCEKCGERMTVKNSRRGPFLACSGYPKCKNAKPLPKEGEESEEKAEEKTSSSKESSGAEKKPDEK